jgi:hypothetical protein
MYRAFNNNRLTKNNHIGLDCHEKQHLLFSLVHLNLCSAADALWRSPTSRQERKDQAMSRRRVPRHMVFFTLVSLLLTFFVANCNVEQGLPDTQTPITQTASLSSTTEPTTTPTLLPFLIAGLVPIVETVFTDEGRVMYIDSGVVRVGVDKDWGGAIREIWFDGNNLVNNWDGGRLIAASLYDGDSKTGFNAGDPEWGWNPCPSDKHDNVNKPITYSYDKGILYIKARYLEWNPDNKGGGKGRPIATDSVVETWIQFLSDDPRAINVRYRVTHEGTKTHALSGQEIGFAYIRTPYNRFVSYAGNAPWTGAPPRVETLAPFPTMGNTAASEQWAGFVDSEDVGLIVWAPQSYPLFSYVYFDNPQGNRQENSTYYMGPRAFFGIGPGFSKEIGVYFYAGKWQDARMLFHRLHQEVDLPDVMHPMGHVDVPTQNATVSGTVDVSGWAVDDRNVPSVEILLDGIRVGQGRQGLPREGVARDYPGLFSAPNSGFVYQLDTRSCKSGTHVLEVWATDAAGNASQLKPGKVTINIQ